MRWQISSDSAFAALDERHAELAQNLLNLALTRFKGQVKLVFQHPVDFAQCNRQLEFERHIIIVEIYRLHLDGRTFHLLHIPGERAPDADGIEAAVDHFLNLVNWLAFGVEV